MSEEIANEKGETSKFSSQSTLKQKSDHNKQNVCLHISKKTLSSESVKFFSDIRVVVTECQDIQKAQDICAAKRFILILLDGEFDRGFVRNLKTKGSCNEQTPVIYISQGDLKDDVKELVKDQFIDDVIFECPTVELDLIKAVRRLLSEPLQFAVTPKSKRGEGNLPKRQRQDKTPMSARRCIANDFLKTMDISAPVARKTELQELQPLSSGNIFTNMDAASGATSWQSYCGTPSSDFSHQFYNHYPTGGPVAGQYNQLQLNADTANRMEMLTAAAEMSQALASIQSDMQQMQDCSSNKETAQKEPTLYAPKPSDADQLPSSNNMQSTMQNAEHAIHSKFHELLTDDMLPKITLSGARQLLDSALMGVQHKSQEEMEQRGHKRTTSERMSNSSTPIEGKEQDRRKSVQRGRRSGSFKNDKTPNNMNENRDLSVEERKELHLAKERVRRERIARSWHQLRKMIPLCDPTADKASVFEMTVAYVHHCWKNYPDKMTIVNKDFERYCCSNGPPDNMDEMDALVDTLLTKEDQLHCL